MFGSAWKRKTVLLVTLHSGTWPPGRPPARPCITPSSPELSSSLPPPPPMSLFHLPAVCHYSRQVFSRQVRQAGSRAVGAGGGGGGRGFRHVRTPRVGCCHGEKQPCTIHAVETSEAPLPSNTKDKQTK